MRAESHLRIVDNIIFCGETLVSQLGTRLAAVDPPWPATRRRQSAGSASGKHYRGGQHAQRESCRHPIAKRYS